MGCFHPADFIPREVKNFPIFTELRKNDGHFDAVAFAGDKLDLELGAGRRSDCGRGKIAIEIPIVVDVGKAHHHAASFVIESQRSGLIRKFSGSVVEVEFVWTLVAASV